MKSSDLFIIFLFPSICLGHEPHQLVRDHPGSAVCLVHHAVLRPRDGPPGAGPDAGVRDGRAAADAQPVSAVPGRADRVRSPHTPVLKIRRPHTHLLQVCITGPW